MTTQTKTIIKNLLNREISKMLLNLSSINGGDYYMEELQKIKNEELSELNIALNEFNSL